MFLSRWLLQKLSVTCLRQLQRRKQEIISWQCFVQSLESFLSEDYFVVVLPNELEQK